MGEPISVFLVALVWVFAGVWAQRSRRQRRAVVVQHRVQYANEQADRKLWELLHETDPAFLVAMGIEEPASVAGTGTGPTKAGPELERHMRQQQEAVLRHRQQMSNSYQGISGVNFPAWPPARLLGSTMGPGFDRQVETELERRLLGNLVRGDPQALPDAIRFQQEQVRQANLRLQQALQGLSGEN